MPMETEGAVTCEGIVYKFSVLPEGEQGCPEVTLHDLIDSSRFQSFGNPLQEAVDAWLAERLPPGCKQHTTIIRYAHSGLTRRTLHFGSTLDVLGGTYEFTFEDVRQQTTNGPVRRASFRVLPSVPPNSILHESAIVEALAAWYGQPLESLSDPFLVYFGTGANRRSFYGGSQFRVSVDGRYYYFRMSGNAEYEEFIVITPLDGRNPLLEARLIETLRKNRRSKDTSSSAVRLTTRSGEQWTVAI